MKDESEVNLRVALTFPDVYEIGMSHVGLKILYGLINGRPDFWAERVMAPWTDREQDLRQKGRGLRSLESGRPLAGFDVIGFSLQYELSYTNVLNMLDLAGLPLAARERGRERPLILGGGPCAFNPEPLADFFDVFFLGDAEAGLMELLDEVAAWKKAGGDKPELLARLARRPGVYVPSFFEPVYDTQGRVIEIKPLLPGYESVRRAMVPDLDQAYFPDSPVVPFAKPVHDRLALEISRGCTRGCRFCQAGFLYRPVRERRPDTILNLADKALSQTGMGEVSFLSLSAGDYTCLPQLMTTFMDAYALRHIALSLPSLRVKSLNTDMMRQIKRVRKTGFTLAPEAGTQRLRDVINKDLTEDDLVSAAGDAFALGWRLIKLYFMIGLPTETEADVKAVADLARRVRAGTKSRVNVSFAAFVPKAHTPFQWESMLDLYQMRERMGLLRGRLKGPGLKPKWNQPAASLLEGVLARGDRRLGRVLKLVQARGARFDAWSEKLDLDLWLKAMAELGLNPGDYLRARERDEVLPWSHLQTGTETEYLWSERERAYLGRKTPDCRGGACGRCGVCDFEEVE
ncbi:MAG: TIGR03960 family B12-binding radical SAM protein, partial [Thermodesulfobacteriota bacterium]|nr:TIGR03960 family B12-binding radical SAM protein [Thermodesulfobacteriota bacterium]